MRSRLAVLVLGATSAIAAASTASAQHDGGSDPPSDTEVQQVFDGTVVHYDFNGSAGYRAAVPGDSLFNTAGRGSGGGGAPVACAVFEWHVPAPDPPVDATTSVPAAPTTLPASVPVAEPSFGWVYREETPDGNWTPENQGQLEQLNGIGPMFGLNLRTDLLASESYYGLHAPLAEATRRFRQSCVFPEAFQNTDGYEVDPNGEYARGYVDVPMRDSFWDPLTRLGILWGMIQLPSFRVIAPPEVNTYGGLVVNMPTWLQIEATAWRPYFTGVDEYMGWPSQLGLFPAELEFEVVGLGGATIPCAPAESEARNGAIPGTPDDLPRYFELGQLDEDCTWVPQESGQVTVRAKITYRVLLTISGYSEWLSPYVWYSDPLTMPVAELRVRNVTPPGGIGD